MTKTKEEWFEVMYNTDTKKLFLKKQTFLRRMIRRMKKHKIITTITMTLIIFSTMNIILIYYFLKILQNL